MLLMPDCTWRFSVLTYLPGLPRRIPRTRFRYLMQTAPPTTHLVAHAPLHLVGSRIPQSSHMFNRVFVFFDQFPSSFPLERRPPVASKCVSSNEAWDLRRSVFSCHLGPTDYNLWETIGHLHLRRRGRRRFLLGSFSPPGPSPKARLCLPRCHSSQCCSRGEQQHEIQFASRPELEPSPMSAHRPATALANGI